MVVVEIAADEFRREVVGSDARSAGVIDNGTDGQRTWAEVGQQISPDHVGANQQQARVGGIVGVFGSGGMKRVDRVNVLLHYKDGVSTKVIAGIGRRDSLICAGGGYGGNVAVEAGMR